MKCFGNGCELEVLKVVLVNKFLYAQTKIVFLPAKRHFAVADELIADNEKRFHNIVGGFCRCTFLAFRSEAPQQVKILPEKRFPASAFDYRTDFFIQELTIFEPFEMQTADANQAGRKIITFLIKKAMQYIRVDEDNIAIFNRIGAVIYGALIATGFHKKNFSDIRMCMQGFGTDELSFADFLQINQMRLGIQFKDIICRFGKGVLSHLASSDRWDKFLKVIINHNKEQNLEVFVINYIKNEQDFKGLILKIHYNEYYKMIF